MPDPSDAIAADRLAERAVRLLERPGYWLDDAGTAYLVRPGADRRRRSLLSLDGAAFERLTRAPGLKPRAGGGYVLPNACPARAKPGGPAGRPGAIEGEVQLIDANGQIVFRPANLGQGAIAGLARRRDSHGDPWLDRRQLLAARRLRDDYEAAAFVGRLTTSWDDAPRGSGPRGPGGNPAERNRAARARVHAAMTAMGPGLAELVDRVCLRCSAMEAAEHELRLPRRSGKAILRMALDRLAAHYRIG